MKGLKQQPPDPIRMTYDEFCDEGARRFGSKGRDWKFKCSICGTVQSWQDFVDAGMAVQEAEKYIGFSCICRFFKDKGECDYTLGGLLRFPGIIVDVEGEEHHRFAFADTDETVQEKPDGAEDTSETLREDQDADDKAGTDQGGKAVGGEPAEATGDVEAPRLPREVTLSKTQKKVVEVLPADGSYTFAQHCGHILRDAQGVPVPGVRADLRTARVLVKMGVLHRELCTDISRATYSLTEKWR